MFTLFGGTTIQPYEANFSASRQETTFVFLSNDSGSYIYSGSNPNSIINGTSSVHLSSLTFEDSGSTFSFVFSGSGFGGSPSSSLPGTTLSASLDGLTNSGSIAAAFTASVVAATNMTASIISSSIVTLINSAYSASATTTHSFSPTALYVETTQIGHTSGYISGSITTGSLTITGSIKVKDGGFELQGNRPVIIGTDKAAGTPTVSIGSPLLLNNDLTITGSNKLTVSSGSLESSTKSAGTATLTGGNVLISGSTSNAFIFLQRISGSNANAGHLYIASQSNAQFAVSSSEDADTGTFNYFILGVTS